MKLLTMKGRFQSWKALVSSCLTSIVDYWDLSIISWSSKELNLLEVSFTVTWCKYVLKISHQVPITIRYDQTNHLHIMHAYRIMYSTAEFLDMIVCVTSENNQNLTHLSNLLLQWYFKLGCTGFFTFQWIGRQCWMGKLVDKMGSNNVKIPKCESFQYEK